MWSIQSIEKRDGGDQEDDGYYGGVPSENERHDDLSGK